MCLNLGEVAVGILTGKTVLVTGIARADSIAFAVADRAMREGADVALTVYPRDLGSASDVIRTLPVKPAFVLPIDVTSEADLATLEAELRTGLGHVDAALHGVAFAPAAALDAVLDVPAAAVEIAFRTSVHSYAALAGVLKRLAPTSGASLVGLDFESGRAWPVYNWMGPCKAALRSLNQYPCSRPRTGSHPGEPGRCRAPAHARRSGDPGLRSSAPDLGLDLAAALGPLRSGTGG